PRRVPDMDRVLQVELLDELGEVVRVGIEVVAVPGLAGTAMAAAIMGDAAVAARSEEKHLVLEGVRAERPAVAEDNRLSRAPVIEIDLCSISGRDRAHLAVSFDGIAAGRRGSCLHTACNPLMVSLGYTWGPPTTYLGGAGTARYAL